MYPILFKPIIKKMIWGSESWEITCRPNEMGIIENGEYAGMAFADFIAKDRAAVLGTHAGEKFPLLVKVIDARDVLSVQVHPNDEYARLKGEADTGKSELWYILTPPTDGLLVVGLKEGVTREVLAKAYEDGTVEQCLNRIKVSRGDIINIPAGLIHALTPGIRVAEIQQNSDITYRLYDFGRVGADGMPRPLHVSDALAVTEFGKINEAAEHFTVEKQTVTSQITATSNPQIFSVYTCVEGSAVFEVNSHTVTVEEARSVFIPARLGEYVIRPCDKGESVVLLKSDPIVNL
ncbi:MAG: class I mannose-6-phosphate isomerase [Defluviitaleaceae bacterium]|nr:class I mannose-6-phosphate isomerase [Defluviitaleaceae bacterium]